MTLAYLYLYVTDIINNSLSIILFILFIIIPLSYLLQLALAMIDRRPSRMFVPSSRPERFIDSPVSRSIQRFHRVDPSGSLTLVSRRTSLI